MVGSEREEKRLLSASSRRLMERRRRNRRKNYAGPGAGSSTGCDVRMGAAILLVCVVFGLAVQMMSHGAQESGLRKGPFLRQEKGARDSSVEGGAEAGVFKEMPDHVTTSQYQQQEDEVVQLRKRGILLPMNRERPQTKDEHFWRDPADGVELEDFKDEEDGGPIEQFLSRGRKFPVVLLTYNRPKELERAIESLRKVRGMDMSDVMVLQDGKDPKVERVVRNANLYLRQNEAVPSKDPAENIALHYKYSLEHAFANREAPAVIIVEDDMLFSPDFLEFFEYNAPILERDPSTLILSAWNDNGFKGRVSDKTELNRTVFFPGLGWLLPRKLYEEELSRKWPKTHWDHWLRKPEQHKGRECIYPEVPRTYHAGAQGTFMDERTHNTLFKDIDYNTDATFTWAFVSETKGQPPYTKAMKNNYENRVEARIKAARHVNDIEAVSAESSTQSPSQEVVLWYSLAATEEKGTFNPFKPLADSFGLWHQYQRTGHNHMHSFRYNGNRRHELHVMLINAAKSTYTSLKPAGLIPADTVPMRAQHLRGGNSGRNHELVRSDVRVVAAQEVSKSCVAVCSEQGMECSEEALQSLNKCDLLKEHFPCHECEASIGDEQPCYVIPDAPPMNYPRKCLTSAQPHVSTCSASHELTYRLCPCVARH